MRDFLLSFIIIITGCHSKVEDREIAVINATLMDMVGISYYHTPLKPPPYRPIHPDSIFSEVEQDIELSIGYEDRTDFNLSKNQPREIHRVFANSSTEFIARLFTII